MKYFIILILTVFNFSAFAVETSQWSFQCSNQKGYLGFNTNTQSDYFIPTKKVKFVVKFLSNAQPVIEWYTTALDNDDYDYTLDEVVLPQNIQRTGNPGVQNENYLFKMVDGTYTVNINWPVDDNSPAVASFSHQSNATSGTQTSSEFSQATCYRSLSL